MDGAAAKGFPEAAVRVLVSALLALYLLAAWGSGIDRISVTAPALERLVPGPFRAQADRSAAAVALAQGDGAAALGLAAEAVLHDPLDPLSSSLLGSARQYRGDTKGAEAAFRVAAQRGWRDRLTQLYWYSAALQSGDAKRAALRADALLRADPYFAAAGTLLEPLEASPAGQAALAARLGENPGWAGAYLDVPLDADARQVRLKSGIALLAARQADSALACDTPRPLVVALLRRGMRRDAEQLWRASRCDARILAGVPAGGLVDGGFERLSDEEASPFGWRKAATGDVSIEPATGSGGVTMRNSAAVSRVVLTQAIGLAPGRYLVRAKVGSNPGSSTGRIAVTLGCGPYAARPENLSGDVAAGGQVLTVGACEGQMLGLWLRPGSGEVTIDDLAIERAP